MRTLSDRYRGLALPVSAGGRDLDAMIEPWALSSLDGHFELIPEPARPDPVLGAGAQQRIQELTAQGRTVFNGATLALQHARPGVLSVRPGTYFDQLAVCEKLLAEGTEGPLRDRADQRADRDPLHNGSGRASAVSVSGLLVLVGPDGDCRFTLGQRSMSLAVAPGDWHVLPAGMLEPADPRILRDGLRRELAEEVCHPGLAAPADIERALDGALVLGVAFDLRRLRLDVCVAIPVADPGRVDPLAAPDEYDQVRSYPLTRSGLRAAIDSHAENLIPVGAGCLELAAVHADALTGRMGDHALAR